MDSFPIENEHNKYDFIQEFFNIEIMKQAVIRDDQLPPDLKLQDEESIELTIQVDNQDAYPRPKFEWYLDQNPAYDLEEKIQGS